MEFYRLPAGFTERPARMEDLEAAVNLFNACVDHSMGVHAYTLAEYDSEWKTPNFNLETDTRVVIDPYGQLIGYYELWDLNEPYVRKYCWGRVHPDYTGCGIGSYLLQWAEGAARQRLDWSPENARVILAAHVPGQHQVARELFQRSGFQPVRQSLRMLIALDTPPPKPYWPEGVTVRSMIAGQDEHAVVQAVRASFRDHWGFVEMPFEQDLARWKHHWETDEGFDPSLHFLATDGDQVAGISLCRVGFLDQPDLGWVNTLGVLRPWRRQGLGLALLQHSFGELYRRGLRQIGLGVDASSLTGATRLYERAGMHSDPNHTYVMYEKELRPGVDLSTQTVEA